MITMVIGLVLGQVPVADASPAGAKALTILAAAPLDAIRTARQTGAVVRDRMERPDVRIVRVDGDLVLIGLGAAEVWIPASAFKLTDLGLQVPISIEDLDAQRDAMNRQAATAAKD